MQLIAAGKPVFCEKPLALNHADALQMTEAAEAAGLVNMVNLTYRNASALQTARRMIEAGEIGEVRHVQASYLQSLAHRPPLGRLAHRGALALAPLLAARLQGRASATSASTSSTSPPSAPASTSSASPPG